MSIKTFISEIFQDQGGGYSSKRIVALLAFILVAMGYIANLFFGLKIEEFIYDQIVNLVFVSLGLTVPEWFKKSGSE